MSKSRNSRKYEHEIEEQKVTRKVLNEIRNKRKEKKLNSALKSKNLKMLFDIDEWKC